jgi:hypothetical protein
MSDHSEHSDHSKHSDYSKQSEHSDHSEHSERSVGKMYCAHDLDGSAVIDLKSKTTLPRPHVPDKRANVVNGRDSVNEFLELSGEILAPSPRQLASGPEQLIASVGEGRPVRNGAQRGRN